MTFAGDVIAKSESSGDDGFTIRHVNCEVIVAGGDDASTARCSYCTQFFGPRALLSTLFLELFRADLGTHLDFLSYHRDHSRYHALGWLGSCRNLQKTSCASYPRLVILVQLIVV